MLPLWPYDYPGAPVGFHLKHDTSSGASVSVVGICPFLLFLLLLLISGLRSSSTCHCPFPCTILALRCWVDCFCCLCYDDC